MARGLSKGSRKGRDRADLTIVCGCSSYAAEWRQGKDVATKVTHDLDCTAEAVAATRTTAGNAAFGDTVELIYR